MADEVAVAGPDVAADTERALDEKLARAATKTRESYARRALEQQRPIGPGAVQRAAEALAAAGRVRRVPADEVVAEIAPQMRAGVVPARFDAATFDSFAPRSPGQRTALAAAQQWVEAVGHGDGSMLALIGPTGVGKSHLLYAAANQLLSSGARVYARGWYRLADELRYGGESPLAFNREGRPWALEAWEVRALLWSQKIILLDEVRPTASTAFDDTELAKFACHAYDAKLSVLLTTNVYPLSDVMGPPAASRFTQVIVDGEDRRQA